MTMTTYNVSVFGRKFEYWYDPSVRIWFAVERDKNDVQVGETIDHPNKNMLLVLIGARAMEDQPSCELTDDSTTPA